MKRILSILLAMMIIIPCIRGILGYFEERDRGEAGTSSSEDVPYDPNSDYWNDVYPDGHEHYYSLEYVDEAYLKSPATCESVAEYYYVCECGKAGEYFFSYGSSLGHNIEIYEEKAATCTEVGWYAYEKCSRCDYTTYEEIPVLEHDIVHHAARKATCAIMGWNAFETCTRCDYTTYEEIPKLGHEIQQCEAKAPTCTEVGWEAYEDCTRPGCRYKYNTYVEIPALGHDIQQHPGQAATCTTSGWDAYETCSRCDYTTYAESTVSGHNYENGICTNCADIQTKGLQYELIEGGTAYSVIGLGDCTDTDLYIPSLYNGLPVTKIGDSAFYGSSSLTSVVIPDSVTTIGNYAFCDCRGLTNVVIPNSVTSIDSGAFSNCEVLVSLVIGDGVTTIGDSAFLYCPILTSVVIPDSVTSIGSSAFSACYTLTTVYYKGTESDWSGISISSENSDLTNATRYYYSESEPDTAGNYWYYNQNGDIVVWTYGLAYQLNGDGVSYTVTGMGEYTGTELYIPATYNNLPVTAIDDGAFLHEDFLTSIVIPDSVTTIGEYAFYSCDSLTSVVIPDSVTMIGFGAFSSCCNVTSVVIGNSVTMIDGDAFSYCTSLTSVEIGDSVTTIGSDAFSDCTSLTSIVIPDSVTTIGSYAFYDCISLTSVVIPDSVATIGGFAFSYCTSLSTVYYAGTESDWSGISISSENSDLTNATRYYYSETQPTTSGNYWHYVGGVPTKW